MTLDDRGWFPQGGSQALSFEEAWDEAEPCLVKAARPDPLDPFRVERAGGASCNPVLLDEVLQQVSMVACVEKDGRLHCAGQGRRAGAGQSSAMALLVSVPVEAAAVLGAATGSAGRTVADSGDGVVTLWATGGDLAVLASRWPAETRAGTEEARAMRSVVDAGPERLDEMTLGWVSGESRCLWGIEAFYAVEPGLEL